MDRNAKRRKRYAEMPQDRKDELLRRRREANAAKKKQQILTQNSAQTSHSPKQRHANYAHEPSLANVGIDMTLSQVSNQEASSVYTNLLASHCLEGDPSNISEPTNDVATNVGMTSLLGSSAEPIGNHASSSTRLLALPFNNKGGSTSIITLNTSGRTTSRKVKHGLVHSNLSTTGQPAEARKTILSRLDKIVHQCLSLPYAPDCLYCGAKRFHLEPPNFCCAGGEVSLVSMPMPYDLCRLFIGDGEECDHFRANVRTYNNNVAFTSFGAKYDRELTKNTKGVYTFRVQGQVYHFLDSLVPHSDKPTGIQLYFFDTDEQLAKTVDASPKLRETTLRLLMHVLADNPYARFFKDLRSVPNIEDYTIVLNCNPGLDQRVYNLPSSSHVAAIWTESDDGLLDKSAHIQVYSHSNTSYRIKHYYSCYDSLQYPLLFPRGESGWYHGIQRNCCANKKQKIDNCEEEIIIDATSITDASDLMTLEQRAADHGKNSKNSVTAREYYCYRLQMRESDRSMLLHSLRLLQQYCVDVYVKIETSRLDFHRKKQDQLRTEALQGVMDSVSSGESLGLKIGRRVILPASFVGGPRDMKRRYLDAMALVQKYGKPDIFLTMTCNPMWKEIQENLRYKEKAQDRPDLVSRVFRAKFELLKHELLTKKIFGDVAACVYVIEFQKRGFPHAHVLLILKPQFKPLNPEAYDKIVCAELPDSNTHPHLYSVVVRHMVHGPCGKMNTKCPCMRSGVCKNHYPKEFCPHTTHNGDSYPSYRRRDDGKKIKVRCYDLDNRWIIPYNPYLLAKFDCHMNVEICSSIKLVKYLYKYIFKGHDLVNFHIMAHEHNAHDVDEISEFQQGRWVSPPEALWRIYGFRLNEMTPAVYSLQVHLPDQQFISFDRNADLLKLLKEMDFSKTMLTEFFKMNATDVRAQHLKCLYKEFPEYFVWNAWKKKWHARSKRRVIGRMVTVSPNEGDRYYLRLLLSHVRGPISFDYLLTVNGQKMDSFREAALRLGLLDSDSYIVDTLEEAAGFQMPSSLRFLFATLLLYCAPTDPKLLLEKFEAEMSRDFHRSGVLNSYSPVEVKRRMLLDINKSLEQMGKHISDYHLLPANFSLDCDHRITKEIEAERNIEVTAEDLLISSKLNAEQKYAFDLILQSVFSSKGQAYFIDGPGGTGKTFLYRSLLATLRSQGYIAIAVATSGVAASILPGGRTAHSRFKIPLDVSNGKVCQLSKQSSTARLIKECKLFVWDEASMAKRETIESFDSLLKDIMETEEPFGGKVVVFGGDFRQTLPVIQRATRDQLVSSSLVNSPLWPIMQKIRLIENMRAFTDPSFSELLIRIGEGTEVVDMDSHICLPSEIVIPYYDMEGSLNRLIEHVFSDLNLFSNDPHQMINHCILAPKNTCVDELNEMMINKFPGQLHVYTSSDKTVDQRHQGDYEDFLNSQDPKGLPPHKLLLKENCPLILLRNLNPAEGLCNGTRLICRKLLRHTICAEIVFGQHKGRQIFVPKIPLQTSDSEKNGIPFIRTQFPVRLCFAMTINKAQGQTLDCVGIYLREPVFSHGQLYVALSRAKTAKSVKVLIVPGTFEGIKTDCKTRNIVFGEILELAR